MPPTSRSIWPAARRRALPTDFAAPADPRDIGAPLPESTWVYPIPDHRALPADADPAELAVLKDSIRLAFVAALQRLPARQRATLIRHAHRATPGAPCGVDPDRGTDQPLGLVAQYARELDLPADL